MRKIAIVVVLIALAAPAAAQTVTGRLEVQEQLENGIYAYEPAWWTLEIPPSDTWDVNTVIEMYYNRTQTNMVATLYCASESGGFPDPILWGRSYTREHFVSISTAIPDDASCSLGLFAGGFSDSVLSYRIRISGLAGSRPTKGGTPFDSPSSNSFRSLSSGEWNTLDAIVAREQAIVAALSR